MSRSGKENHRTGRERERDVTEREVGEGEEKYTKRVSVLKLNTANQQSLSQLDVGVLPACVRFTLLLLSIALSLSLLRGERKKKKNLEVPTHEQHQQR